MMISIRAVVRNLLGFGASIDRSLRTHVKSRVTVPLLVTSLTLIGALFLTLFLTRIGVGVGEASLSPAGYSMLSDYFPKQKLGAGVVAFTAIYRLTIFDRRQRSPHFRA